MAENGPVQPVSDKAFQNDVLNASRPTLVDFWAAWCAPCRAVAPVVEELAHQYGNRISFKKINIDENPSTPAQYGVKGIPTLILFKNGQILDQIVGAVAKEKIEALLKKAI
ncbi:MAG: thioredoxin [Pseudomonadota bacterium]